MTFAVDKDEIQEIRDNIDTWATDMPLYAADLLCALGWVRVDGYKNPNSHNNITV